MMNEDEYGVNKGDHNRFDPVIIFVIVVILLIILFK